jgi:signal peptidase II
VKKRILLVAGCVALLLILDQILKIYIKTNFTPNETRYILGDWFALHYIENQGMAFGTTLGSSIYGKLALSIFRILAIGGIVYYVFLEIKKGAKTFYLFSLAMILAGATGNLIDSMFYDFWFTFNPCESYNQLQGSGIKADCNQFGMTYPVEVRNKGFLFGNVVDMFQFDAYWPKWMPLVGGQAVFPAIWNLADSCISVGVAFIILIHRKSIFSFRKKSQDAAN